MTIEIGSAQRPADGEVVSGDAFIVLRSDSDLLVAVIDGLGHGPNAARAAQVLSEYIEGHSAQPLDSLLQGADRAVAGTRGAAATLGRITMLTHSIDIAGVGNVGVRAASREKIQPLPHRGILGRGIRAIRTFQYALAEGDLVAFYTDGISGSFDLDRYRMVDVTTIAHALIEEHGRSHDDATCVVLRRTG